MTQTIDPITVEVLGNAFASLVEEIGIALMKASYSTNAEELVCLQHTDMLSLTLCPPT